MSNLVFIVRWAMLRAANMAVDKKRPTGGR